MKFSTCCAALLMACTAQSHAATFYGGYDCGEWLKAGGHQSARAWLLGYLSGINYASASGRYDPLGQISSAEQIYAWMDNYCKADPLSTLTKGGNALFKELERRAKK